MGRERHQFAPAASVKALGNAGSFRSLCHRITVEERSGYARGRSVEGRCIVTLFALRRGRE